MPSCAHVKGIKHPPAALTKTVCSQSPGDRSQNLVRQVVNILMTLKQTSEQKKYRQEPHWHTDLRKHSQNKCSSFPCINLNLVRKTVLVRPSLNKAWSSYQLSARIEDSLRSLRP